MARTGTSRSWPDGPRRRRRWPRWSGWAAAAWSLGYGALGIFWTLGGNGYPFGEGHDPAPHLSVLGSVDPEVGAPVVAALGLIGALVAVAMSRGWGRGGPRLALLVFAWTLATVLALVIPDFRVLVVLAYAPILVAGAPFGWPGDVRFLDAIPWPVLNQALCMAGGLLWAAAATAYGRRTRGACEQCGRSDTVSRWTTPEAAARWGRASVVVAVIVPVVYAVTRWAWALGVPLGIGEEFYRMGEAIGLWWIGAALGTLAIGAALLTLGLVQRWGEDFPRWIPVLGGRAVPRSLVVVPGTVSAVVVTAAGSMFVRMALMGTFTLGDHAITLSEHPGALLPELLWPAWGVALGAATLAYHLRTRGVCADCGRG